MQCERVLNKSWWTVQSVELWWLCSDIAQSLLNHFKQFETVKLGSFSSAKFNNWPKCHHELFLTQWVVIYHFCTVLIRKHFMVKAPSARQTSCCPRWPHCMCHWLKNLHFWRIWRRGGNLRICRCLHTLYSITGVGHIIPIDPCFSSQILLYKWVEI